MKTLTTTVILLAFVLVSPAQAFSYGTVTTKDGGGMLICKDKQDLEKMRLIAGSKDDITLLKYSTSVLLLEGCKKVGNNERVYVEKAEGNFYRVRLPGELVSYYIFQDFISFEQ